MASTRTLTAPSSSSFSNPPWKYRVFLSFHGEDTRESFINHLLASLEDKWSVVCGDDDALEHGKHNCEGLLKVLRESICAIVVISKAYAFSKRCLIELTEILECMYKDGLKVFPIFYHVNPSDVQNQKGDFERAFAEHEKSPEVKGKQRVTWIAALYKIGSRVDGRCVLDDRYLAEIIEGIKENILRAFSVEVSNSSQVFVGIQPRVNEIMALLRIGSDDFQIVGIYGSAGIGKTTLAEVICSKVASHFNGGCFLVDFRGKNKKQGIVELRRLILRVTGSRAASPQVLLVLDDVNSREQLEQLANCRSCLGAGSRILVISRDEHLLNCCADETYMVKSLTNIEAFRLFCWSVFSKFHPNEDFSELSQEVIDYAGGLPLALIIIGSSLKDRTKAQWRSYIDEIRKANSDGEAQWRSFIDEIRKANSDGEAQWRSFIDEIWKAYYDENAQWTSYIDEIRKANSDWLALWRSYIAERDKENFKRVQPIIYMPRQIKNFNRRRRDNQGMVDRIFWNVLKLSFERLAKLEKEVFLHIACFFHGLDIDYIISKLDSLYHHPCLLIEVLRSKSWVKITKRREVHIHELLQTMGLQIVRDKSPKELGRRNRLWNTKDIIYVIKNKSAFEKSKRNDLIKSHNLIKTPNLSKVPNLEILELAYCRSLCMVDPSIGLLKQLKKFNLRACVSLETFPTEVDCLSFLDSLDLSRNKFRMIPDIFSSLSSLRKLHLNNCDLTDESFPKSLCCLSSLEVLDLSENKFTQIPDGVWQLSELQELYLEDCNQLKLLSKLPLRLGHLHLKNCLSLSCFCDQIDTATSSGIWGTIDLSFWSVHFHHGKPYRILHLHQGSPLWVKLKAQIFDAFVACGLTMGRETPEWFNHRSTPSFGSIGRQMDLDWDLDLDEDSEDWKGCAIFIDFEIHEHGNWNTRMSDGSNHTYLYFLCRFQIEEVSLREPLVVCVPEVPPSGRHGVWAYIPAEWFGERGNNLDRRIGLEASNATQNLNVKVNHCGLRLVRQHDLSGMYEELRSISDLQGWENLFCGDLGTLKASGPIEGNIMLKENIRPTRGPLDKLSDEELGNISLHFWDAFDKLSDEVLGNISPHISPHFWDAFDNLSDEELGNISPHFWDAIDNLSDE